MNLGGSFLKNLVATSRRFPLLPISAGSLGRQPRCCAPATHPPLHLKSLEPLPAVFDQSTSPGAPRVRHKFWKKCSFPTMTAIEIRSFQLQNALAQLNFFKVRRLRASDFSLRREAERFRLFAGIFRLLPHGSGNTPRPSGRPGNTAKIFRV